MTQRPLARLGWLPILVLAVVACGGSSASAGPSDAASPVPSDGPSDSVSASPSTSEVPATESAAPAMTQTDTAWGRIWDGVPAGFPRFTGARPADDATPEPVSDAYAVEGGDAAEIAGWLQSAMEGATYSTESLSGPLEDEGFVLDSVGEGDCRIQTTVAPMGGLILVTVRYGAACPAT